MTRPKLRKANEPSLIFSPNLFPWHLAVRPAPLPPAAPPEPRHARAGPHCSSGYCGRPRRCEPPLAPPHAPSPAACACAGGERCAHCSSSSPTPRHAQAAVGGAPPLRRGEGEGELRGRRVCFARARPVASSRSPTTRDEARRHRRPAPPATMDS